MGADLVQHPVRISALVSFKGEKRTLTDADFTRIAEKLVDRAATATGLYEQLPSYELNALGNAVANSLRALGDLTMDDVQAVRLGHRALARALLRESPSATIGLSTDAVLLHERILETACLHILHFFTQRSSFVPRTLVEHSRQIAELSETIDRLISRTPAPADTPYESRYLSYMADKHSELNVFGLDLVHSPHSWPLDSAYLSLEASTRAPGPGPGLMPAEQVLSGRDRVLLRGVAGSGKTTLIQWLAVTTAGRKTGDQLLDLYGLVPFVLPLRTLTRASGAALPGPDRFLDAVGCTIAGEQPTGWAHRVLSEGRGLLLVDGIDEIPEHERLQVRTWLRDLLLGYPRNRWLVTSRPSAVRDDWLAGEEFTELDLAPMSPDNVGAFVRRWHVAAGAGDALAHSLLQALRRKQDLGRLATNPLMCALICALHQERRGYLPNGRMELYSAALSMLLARRDRERGIVAPERLVISEAHQIQLLQRLAYWMIRNERSEMDHADAVTLLDRALPALPVLAERSDSETIFRHLLNRSGLLRAPSVSTVDFIHRTFQDYLGAKAAVEELDFDVLVSNAHLDQWEDVIRMSIAHARPAERAKLLTSLLNRGDEGPDPGHRLHLLAATCLEHATELDPTVHREVQQRAAALIPPRSRDQARAMIEVGPVALELLPGPEGLTVEECYHTVLTAAGIATDAAIPVLAQYCLTADPRVRELLVRSWSRFDTVRYAAEVVSQVDDGDLYFPVSHPAQVRALAAHGGRHRIAVTGGFPLQECAPLCHARRVTHLRLTAETELDAAALSCFRDVHQITVGPATALLDLGEFAELPSLRSLHVSPATALLGEDALPRHVRVEVHESLSLAGQDLGQELSAAPVLG